MKILVTGGTGYIGSHTCVELLNEGYEIVIIDNLSNSKIEVVDKIKKITNKNFDFYLLNLYTFTLLRQYCLPRIYNTYDMNRDLFNFRDEEIREIFKKSILLDKTFNGELIIDKINCRKDLKKIKSKIF